MNDVRILTIILPENNGTATVTGGTTLCYASGHATGTQLQEVLALCEPLADQNTPPSEDYEDEVKEHGVSANLQWDGDWDVNYISDAQGDNKWNALHVYTFYYGSPGNVPPPVHDTAVFQGINGSCYGSSSLLEKLTSQKAGKHPMLVELGKAAQSGSNEVLGRIKKWIQTLDAVSERELTPPWLVREPSGRDGDWLKYTHLPIDIASGPFLMLDGKFLRAASISLAVESISIRRHARPPIVDLTSPLGTGVPAPSGHWRFPGISKFALVANQRGGLPGTDVTELIFSISRETPTHLRVDPTQPIRIAVNSPRTEDWLNEGFVNLWVRVNTR